MGMCKAIEDLVNEAREEARKEGYNESCRELLIELYEENAITIEKLSELLEISKEEAQKLVKPND